MIKEKTVANGKVNPVDNNITGIANERWINGYRQNIELFVAKIILLARHTLDKQIAIDFEKFMKCTGKFRKFYRKWE